MNDKDIQIVYKYPELNLIRDANNQKNIKIITYEYVNEDQTTKEIKTINIFDNNFKGTVERDGEYKVIVNDEEYKIISEDLLPNIFYKNEDEMIRANVKYDNYALLSYKNGRILLNCTSFAKYNCVNFINKINLLNIDIFDEFHRYEGEDKFFNEEYRFDVKNVIVEKTKKAYYLNNATIGEDSALISSKLTEHNEENHYYTVKIKEAAEFENIVEEVFLELIPLDKKTTNFINSSFLPEDKEAQIEGMADPSLMTKEVIITSFVSSDYNLNDNFYSLSNSLDSLNKVKII